MILVSFVVFAVLCLVALPLTFIIGHFLFKLSKKFCYRNVKAKYMPYIVLVFVTVFILTLIIFIIFFLAFKPGLFEGDCRWQLEQVQTNKWANWHPIVDTFFVYKIPLLLTNNLNSIVLFQIIFFAFAISLLMAIVYKHSNLVYMILSYFLTLLNANTIISSLIPWKDTTFAICITIYMCFIGDKMLSNKSDKRKTIIIATFCLLLCFASLIKHNAVIATIFFLLILLYLYNLKHKVIIALSFISLVFSINAILNSLYSNEFNPDSIKRPEMYSIPCSIISGVLERNPEILTYNSKYILYNISPVWLDDKENTGLLRPLITNNNKRYLYNHTKDILWIASQCIMKDPVNSLYGLLEINGYIFCYNTYFTCHMQMNAYKYAINHLSEISNENTLRYSLMTYLDNVKYLFSSIGHLNLLLILICFSKCKIFEKKSRLKIFLCMSFILYNLSIVPLSITKDYKYFYFEFLLFPIFLLIMYKDDKCIKAK